MYPYFLPLVSEEISYFNCKLYGMASSDGCTPPCYDNKNEIVSYRDTRDFETKEGYQEFLASSRK